MAAVKLSFTLLSDPGNCIKKSWGHPFEVKSAKEGTECPIHGKGSYHRTSVFRIPDTLEPLT